LGHFEQREKSFFAETRLSLEALVLKHPCLDNSGTGNYDPRVAQRISQMNDRIRNVGFIGLGRMGKPMAINILNAGFGLTVYDSRDEPVRELTSLGARAATSPKEVAEASDLLAIAVVDDAQVEEVFGGAGGVLEGSCAGSTVAIHSTVYPGTVSKLAQLGEAKGVQVIDAPISGGEAGARAKSLCYMVGGESAILERCRDVFAASAAEIFHMGGLGSGAAAKMIVQVVTCINMLAAHEGEILAVKSGLDFAKLQAVLHASSGQSFVADHWLHRFKGAQDPMEVRSRRTEVFQKSLAPAIEMARQLGLPLAGTVLVERLLPQIMAIEDQ
jgi:3-hydroxyisobutyrate dehydrogenase-like beta-hydroxyacid dehydrogenase